MLDNRFQEPIYFQEELVKIYADSRKALEEKDVKDLLRCLVSYLSKNKKDNYAYELPKIGFIYDNKDIFNHKDKLYEKKMGEYFCGNPAYHQRTIFDRHKKTKEELQQFQNEIFYED